MMLLMFFICYIVLCNILILILFSVEIVNLKKVAEINKWKWNEMDIYRVYNNVVNPGCTWRSLEVCDIHPVTATYYPVTATR